MKTKNKKTVSSPKEVKASKVLNKYKMNKVRKFILTESKKQSPARKRRNDLLTIKYMIQDLKSHERELCHYFYYLGAADGIAETISKTGGRPPFEKRFKEYKKIVTKK